MEIYILNKELDTIFVIDSFISLVWNERYYEAGDFQLQLFASSSAIPYMAMDNYLQIDSSKKLMIIEHYEPSVDTEKGEIIMYSGRSLESILNRRIVWKQTNFSGKLSDVIAKLINDSFINPENPDRKVANFYLREPSSDIKAMIVNDTQFTGDPVGDATEYFCKSNQVGYEIVLRNPNNNKQLVVEPDSPVVESDVKTSYSFQDDANMFIPTRSNSSNLFLHVFPPCLEDSQNQEYIIWAKDEQGPIKSYFKNPVTKGDITESWNSRILSNPAWYTSPLTGSSNLYFFGLRHHDGSGPFSVVAVYKMEEGTIGTDPNYSIVATLDNVPIEYYRYLYYKEQLPMYAIEYNGRLHLFIFNFYLDGLPSEVQYITHFVYDGENLLMLDDFKNDRNNNQRSFDYNVKYEIAVIQDPFYKTRLYIFGERKYLMYFEDSFHSASHAFVKYSGTPVRILIHPTVVELNFPYKHWELFSYDVDYIPEVDEARFIGMDTYHYNIIVNGDGTLDFTRNADIKDKLIIAAFEYLNISDNPILLSCYDYKCYYYNAVEKQYMGIELGLYKGVDRTSSQTDNIQVEYSANNENLYSAKLTVDKKNYKNVTLIGGEGEGLERRTATYGVATGLDRREYFTDARDISSDVEEGETPLTDEEYESLLIERGKQKLEEYIVFKETEAEIDSSENSMYAFNRDYYLGDIIDYVDAYGTRTAARVVELTTSITDTGISTHPILETEHIT